MRSEEEGVEFSFAIIGLLGTVLGYVDEYPFTQIDHKDLVNVEELRLDSLMSSFKSYIGTNQVEIIKGIVYGKSVYPSI